MARYANKVFVCLDNQEAALRLLVCNPTPSSSPRITQFRGLATAWTRRDRCHFTEVGSVIIKWCPAHVGILGNEAADVLAKQACTLPASSLAPSISRAKRDIKVRCQDSATRYWTQNAPERYKQLGIRENVGDSLELRSLDRRTLGLLLAARSGHGDFADYHRRFQHLEALLTCSCGREKSPDHFFFCRLERSRARLQGGPRHPNPGIPWALSSPEGAIAFSNWVRKTKFF